MAQDAAAFVTHDPEEALKDADRVVVMREGHIGQAGLANRSRDRLVTRFVHGFVGESAALPAAVERR